MQVQILGFNFTKVSAERFLGSKPVKDPKDRKITTNINFTDVEKENIPILKEEAAKVSFNFTVLYEPKHAELSFNGAIILKLEKEDLKNVIKEWKKKKLPEELRVPLFNLILSKCSLRALQLEEELNLPTHIPLPRVSKQQFQNQA